MISDEDLYQLAIFLGSCAMLLIILYHFLEINSKDTLPTSSPYSAPGKSSVSSTSSKHSGVASSGAGGSSAAGKRG
jgi:dolichyl-diphosphooligosaccharide---protein glycosyltransferase subunit 4